MLLMEVFGALLLMSASTGALAGALVARKKTRAIEAAMPEHESAPSAGPFRTAAPVSEPARTSGARRRGRLFTHDYDRMIGRTFFR